MECNEGKEYNALDSLDDSTLNNLKELEAKLKKTPFIKGIIISVDDVTAYDNFMLLNIKISKETYPNIMKWKTEIERMKLNWKISKKPNRGRTFLEYVQNMTLKLNQQNKEFDDKMKEITKMHNNILKHGTPEKEVTTIHFFVKKDNEFTIKILVKFLPDQKTLTVNEVASKLAIISHNHLPNKTNIEPSKNDKGEISAVISSTIDKKEYDIENLAQDLKRNIQGIYSVSILSIESAEQTKSNAPKQISNN